MNSCLERYGLVLQDDDTFFVRIKLWLTKGNNLSYLLMLRGFRRVFKCPDKNIGDMRDHHRVGP